MDTEPFQCRTIDKPWGHEVLWALTEHYAGKLLHIRGGEALSLQYHTMKDEWLYTLDGEVSLEVGVGSAREVRILAGGESIHIPPGVVHRLSARTDAIVLEVSTPELDDVVRLQDRYGRTEVLQVEAPTGSK